MGIGDDKQNVFNIKPLLVKLKTELFELKEDMERSGFSKSNNYQEANSIDRITKLIDNNKIKINERRRFKVREESEKMGGGCQETCWKSLNIIEKGSKAIAREQSSFAKRMLLQETIVIGIAQRQGLLFNEEDKRNWGVVLSQGTEALVYYDSKKVGKVIKTLDYSRNRGHDLSEFAERMIGFNVMFPQTKHILIGFVEEKNMSGDRLMLKPVLQQKFVEGETLLKFSNSEYEFEKAMDFFRGVGYIVENGNMLCKKDWIAEDLNLGNIIKSPGKQYFVIDAFVRKSFKNKS